MVFNVTLRIAGVLFRYVLGWVDRATDAPIMNRRVNKGSEYFFSNRDRIEQGNEFDEVTGTDVGPVDLMEERYEIERQRPATRPTATGKPRKWR